MLITVKNSPVMNSRPKNSTLSMMPLFKNLSSDALQDLKKNMVEKKYAKRESIFLEDDQAEFVWFVQEGHVKEIHHAPDGRSNTLCMVGPNGLFGASAFNGGDYGFHCVAETDCAVISFHVQYFLDFMGKHTQVARDILSKISILLRRAEDMHKFSHESAENRVLHVLLELAGEFGDVIPLTRREIAEMAGTSVETCIRTCVRLQEAGLLKSMNGRVMVRDAVGLRDRMEEL